MEIIRNDKEEGTGFPEWERGEVVEIFDETGSRGLYMMVYVEELYLVSLANGNWWSSTPECWDGITHAVVRKCKLIVEK